MNVIKLKNLTKEYRRYKKTKSVLQNFFNRKYEIKEAIKELNLEIYKGEIIGLLGQNGAGKTTLIKLMSGILKPSSGSISVLNYNPQKEGKEFKKKIALILGQKPQMWWDVSAMDNFILHKAIYEISDIDFTKRLNEMLDYFDAHELVSSPVRTLSLGERMKYEIICLLLHKPEIIFLDEPTIGLDVTTQELIQNFFKLYRDKYQATIIITSHYMGDIEEMCDRVIFIEHGVKYFDGTLHDFKKQYATKLVLSIDIEEAIDKDWESYGKLLLKDKDHIRLEIDKKKAKALKKELLAMDEVQSVQIFEQEASEIVKNHFKIRKTNYEEID